MDGRLLIQVEKCILILQCRVMLCQIYRNYGGSFTQMYGGIVYIYLLVYIFRPCNLSSGNWCIHYLLEILSRIFVILWDFDPDKRTSVSYFATCE
jgi:hypothetical protein